MDLKNLEVAELQVSDLIDTDQLVEKKATQAMGASCTTCVCTCSCCTSL